jgi:hypothetical protein
MNPAELTSQLSYQKLRILQNFPDYCENYNEIIIKQAHLHLRISSVFKSGSCRKCWFPYQVLCASSNFDHLIEASFQKLFWLNNNLLISTFPYHFFIIYLWW